MQKKLNAKQLRDFEEGDAIPHIKRFPVYFILDNIYDTYNIGGLFRLADALAIEKLYICGQSETPPNPKIKKASIGTYKIVPWEYAESTTQAISKLRADIPKIKIVALEQDNRSVPYHTYTYTTPIAFIAGNETSGASQETLDLCDDILEIPMLGVNVSLNVIVSTAIVAHHAYNQLDFLSPFQV